MKTPIRAALAATLLFVLLLLAGCAGSSGEDSGEGMAVWGYIASADSAQLELAESQPGATSLLVDRVLVPEDSWIVVHLDDEGMPGERVGLLGVEKGESSDLVVPLEGVTTDNVIVAIHADRGDAGVFDFDMEKKETSPDRPFFVDGAELAAVVGVR